jgi:hypothetical protein
VIVITSTNPIDLLITVINQIDIMMKIMGIVNLESLFPQLIIVFAIIYIFEDYLITN